MPPTSEDPPGPRARTRNPRGQGDRLRSEILRAAQAIVDSEPGDAMTLRAVARRAGITAPSIYRHFGDRDEIMQALVENAFAELRAELETALRAASTPGDRLRRICAGYLGFAERRPRLYRLMFGGVWDAADRLETDARRGSDQASTVGLDVFAMLVEAVRECAPGEDSFRAATALWVALHGYADLLQRTATFPWPSGLEEDLIRPYLPASPPGRP